MATARHVTLLVNANGGVKVTGIFSLMATFPDLPRGAYTIALRGAAVGGVTVFLRSMQVLSFGAPTGTAPDGPK